MDSAEPNINSTQSRTTSRLISDYFGFLDEPVNLSNPEQYAISEEIINMSNVLMKLNSDADVTDSRCQGSTDSQSYSASISDERTGDLSMKEESILSREALTSVNDVLSNTAEHEESETRTNSGSDVLSDDRSNITNMTDKTRLSSEEVTSVIDSSAHVISTPDCEEADKHGANSNSCNTLISSDGADDTDFTDWTRFSPETVASVRGSSVHVSSTPKSEEIDTDRANAILSSTLISDDSTGYISMKTATGLSPEAVTNINDPLDNGRSSIESKHSDMDGANTDSGITSNDGTEDLSVREEAELLLEVKTSLNGEIDHSHNCTENVNSAEQAEDMEDIRLTIPCQSQIDENVVGMSHDIGTIGNDKDLHSSKYPAKSNENASGEEEVSVERNSSTAADSVFDDNNGCDDTESHNGKTEQTKDVHTDVEVDDSSVGNKEVILRRGPQPLNTSTATPNSDDDDACEDDGDEDAGVYDESLRSSKWIYTKEDETLGAEEDLDEDPEKNSPASDDHMEPIEENAAEISGHENGFSRHDSMSTTASEVEYRRAYREVSIKSIQRKSSLQKFARENTAAISADKLIVLERQNELEGLGFKVVGSHPTSVSTVVRGSIADKAGIEVGDVIIAVNYDGVLHRTQEEIADILKSAGNVVKLELCKESSLKYMGVNVNQESTQLYCGYMQKLANSFLNIWKKRWFVLKTDNCLYYYKTKEDRDILGAIPLAGYMVLKDSKPHSMKLVHSAKTYRFATENENDCIQWVKLLKNATSKPSNMDSWLDESSHKVGLPALSIRDPDCCGHIYKTGWKNKSWKKRYAVLKDACLFYYCSIDSPSAQGVAHLHGYTVNLNPQSSKKNAFDLVPMDSRMRTFHFYVETEVDKERWVRAMKLSIGRWIKV